LSVALALGDRRSTARPVALIGGGSREVDAIIDNHRRAAEDLAHQLGLDAEIRDSLGQAFERWDGKGTPGLAREGTISLASRLVSLADVVEVFHRLGGVEAAVAVARERRGTQFDPDLVDLFESVADEILVGLGGEATWNAVIAAEPNLDVVLTGARPTRRYGSSHSRGCEVAVHVGHLCAVADLAEPAARAAGLVEADAVLVRRAAMSMTLAGLASNAI
jgi:hypothetical protein